MLGCLQLEEANLHRSSNTRQEKHWTLLFSNRLHTAAHRLLVWASLRREVSALKCMSEEGNEVRWPRKKKISRK